MSNSRLTKASNDKLYYIDSEKQTDIKKIYKIMGSTGNIYNVTLSTQIKCSCPDFIYRHKRCKHIYFVIIKMFKLQDVDKDNYTKNELSELINRQDITNGVTINNELLNKYKKIKDGKVQEIIPQTDDSCPICLDDITNGDTYIFCKYSCGKCVHEDCYTHWTTNREKKCVFCTKYINKLPDSSGNYVNLLI